MHFEEYRVLPELEMTHFYKVTECAIVAKHPENDFEVVITLKSGVTKSVYYGEVKTTQKAALIAAQEELEQSLADVNQILSFT